MTPFQNLLNRLKKDVRLLEAWAKRLKPKPGPQTHAGRAQEKGPYPPAKIKAKPASKPKPLPEVVMFDSIELSTIPNTAEAVAGYKEGKWPNFPEALKRFPRAKHLSIAVFASGHAECLDVENGDATPNEAPAWVKRQKSRGIQRPVLYISLSEAAKLIRILGAAGIKRTEVRLWTAHYTYKAHRCSPSCGFQFPTHADATQWTDRALNRNLDESLCAGSFFQ